MKRQNQNRVALPKRASQFGLSLLVLAVLSACAPMAPKWYSSHPEAKSRGFFDLMRKERKLRGAPVASKGNISVRKGDTYYKISLRHKVPLRALLEVNKARPPYSLSAGQKIKLPVQAFHTVRAKETLYAISRKYNTDVSTLAALNQISKPFSIRIGQKLQVPDERAGRAASLGRPAPDAKLTEAKSQTKKTVSQKRVKRAALPAAPRRVGRFQVPVQGKVISNFGTKPNGLHNDGINIAARNGTPIKAAENGVVVYTGNELRGYGNLLLVRHGEGWVTAYAHASKFLVKPGDRVKQGQSIAEVGQTGNVDRPQVHFEVRKGTRAVNPKSLI
ncbi:MAG: M23 family metallopeptidase [Rhodobiaceae bacterium]|nr:M23 family metallopeptidase [Rhodobiaceae bacterium]